MKKIIINWKKLKSSIIPVFTGIIITIITFLITEYLNKEEITVENI